MKTGVEQIARVKKHVLTVGGADKPAGAPAHDLSDSPRHREAPGSRSSTRMSQAEVCVDEDIKLLGPVSVALRAAARGPEYDIDPRFFAQSSSGVSTRGYGGMVGG